MKRASYIKAPAGHVSPADAQVEFSISRATIYRWIASGLVKTVRVGRLHLFVERESVRKLLAGVVVDPKPGA